MAKDTSLVLYKIFIQFGRHSLKYLAGSFVKIDAVYAIPHFTGGGLKKLQFLPSEIILSIGVKFGTRDPHLMLSSNCEFVETCLWNS